MSEPILREFVCPNCNAPLPYDPSAPKVECPACLSVFLIQTDSDNSSTVKNVTGGSKPQEAEQPLLECSQDAPAQQTRLYPFTVGLKEYREKLYHWFGNDDYLPHDFYREVTFVSQKAVYVPYYLVNGSFTVPYNYQIKKKFGENVYWFDRSGQTNTDVEAQIYVGQLPEEWTSQLPDCSALFEKAVATGGYSDFKGSDVSGYTILEPTLTKDEVLEKHTKPIVRKQVDRAANKAANKDPHSVRRVKAGYDGTVYHTLAYLPFYVTEYQYKGQRYIHVADGTDFNKSKGTRPQCEDIKKEAENVMGPANIGCGLYILAGIVVGIIHWITGGLSDTAWQIFAGCGIPFVIVYLYYSGKKGAYLKQERQKRSTDNSIENVNLDEFFSR